jgi:hypothetical protein
MGWPVTWLRSLKQHGPRLGKRRTASIIRVRDASRNGAPPSAKARASGVIADSFESFGDSRSDLRKGEPSRRSTDDQAPLGLPLPAKGLALMKDGMLGSAS